MILTSIVSTAQQQVNVSDTIEYKLIQISKENGLYYIQEDNEDGTIYIKIQNNQKEYAYSYNSRMQALREYTSKGWIVLDMEIEERIFIYQLQRKRQ